MTSKRMSEESSNTSLQCSPSFVADRIHIDFPMFELASSNFSKIVLQKLKSEQESRWNFDFSTMTPLSDGDWQWEKLLNLKTISPAGKYIGHVFVIWSNTLS